MKKRILLVGHSDTCLTPLCKAMLNCMCLKKGLSHVAVESCGFWAIGGRGVDPHTYTVAGELGIDLSTHQATYITEDLVSHADLIIPQDETIARGLREFLRRDMSRVGKPMKLNNPAGLSLETYRFSRQEVYDFCNRLLRKLTAELREQEKKIRRVILRPVTPEEAEDVCRLEEACFAHPWSKSAVESELCKDTGCFVGAYDGERLVGYGSFYTACGVAYVNNIAVEKAYRHIGIGDQILEYLEAWCGAHGIELMTLEVRSRNKEAIGLYEKHGFVNNGCRPGFYRDPSDDAIIMNKLIQQSK